MDEYVGVIKAFAGSYAPVNYMTCEGQLLSIAKNNVLYAVIGNTYGGDGVSNFALPDLRGRSIISAGQGPGLAVNHALGKYEGVEEVLLTVANMPMHTHTAASAATFMVSNQKGTIQVPVDNNAIAVMMDANNDAVAGYNAESPSTPIAGASVATTIGVAGGSQPISTLPPTLALTYIICVSGLYPSRP